MLSTDELALLSSHLKCLAQIRDETLLHYGVIVVKSADDPVKKIIVIFNIVKQVI